MIGHLKLHEGFIFVKVFLEEGGMYVNMKT